MMRHCGVFEYFIILNRKHVKDTVQELVVPNALYAMTTSILERIIHTCILILKLKTVTSEIFLRFTNNKCDTIPNTNPWVPGIHPPSVKEQTLFLKVFSFFTLHGARYL